MSKAALDHWSADAAAEYAEKGIRVNTVSPGPIRTEFMKRHGVEGEQAQKVTVHAGDPHADRFRPELSPRLFQEFFESKLIRPSLALS